MQSAFHIEVIHERGATVLRLRGELDVATAPELEQEVAAIEPDDGGMLVIDLREVAFMDSTGLRALLAADRSARDMGREFGIVQGSEQVRRLLALTRVDDRLRVAEHADELLGTT